MECVMNKYMYKRAESVKKWPEIFIVSDLGVWSTVCISQLIQDLGGGALNVDWLVDKNILVELFVLILELGLQYFFYNN